ERAAVDVWAGTSGENRGRRRHLADWQDGTADRRCAQSGHYRAGRQRRREIAAHRLWGQVMLRRASSSTAAAWKLGIGSWVLSVALIFAAAITVFSGQT